MEYAREDILTGEMVKIVCLEDKLIIFDIERHILDTFTRTLGHLCLALTLLSIAANFLVDDFQTKGLVAAAAFAVVSILSYFAGFVIYRHKFYPEPPVIAVFNKTDKMFYDSNGASLGYLKSFKLHITGDIVGRNMMRYKLFIEKPGFKLLILVSLGKKLTLQFLEILNEAGHPEAPTIIEKLKQKH